MPEFTLPSGRVVQMKSEPNYGDECRLVFVGLKDQEEYHYAKFAVMCFGLSRSEVEAMPREDGRALAVEVNKRLAWRADTDETPFDKTSPSSSKDTTLSPDSPPSASENFDSANASTGVIPS